MKKYDLIDTVSRGSNVRKEINPQLIVETDGNHDPGLIFDANATIKLVLDGISSFIGDAPDTLDTLEEIATKIQELDNIGFSDVALSGDYNDLTNKPTIPTIPTNLSDFVDDLGSSPTHTHNQYLTSHQDISNYIQKSQTSGLIKNDGTVDTNTYLTSHQDITNKADKNEMSVVDGTGDNIDKTTITLKAGTSATVLKSHLSLNGYATEAYVTNSLSGKQDTLIAGLGISITNGVISNAATEETVSIVVLSEVTGFDPEGLVVNVYYNDATAVSTTVTLDAQGRGVLQVPHDYKYKMVLPSVVGFKDLAPIVHYSTLVQRSIEVEYVEPDESSGMQLTIFCGTARSTGVSSGSTPVVNLDVDVTIDGSTTTYTTGSDGKLLITVPFDKSATVVVPVREGYELKGTRSRTFSATQSAKYSEYIYYVAEPGIKIVTTDGTEYSEESFAEALENEEVTTSDAKLVKVSTSELAANNGIFYLSLDTLATRNGIASKLWIGSYVQFYDIPLNGNSASANYYYDGRTASGLIQDEGDRRNITTLAVDEALGSTFTLGERTLYGFLGSIGQWSILWANRYIIDSILSITRPSAAYNFSTYITNKWTSTQNSEAVAYAWTTAANTSNFKTTSCNVVPFFTF